MKYKKVTELKDATQRGLVIHAAQDPAEKPFPLVDLVPDEAKGKKGTFKITIEFDDGVK